MPERKNNLIWTDDVCIYVRSKVTNPLSGKIALLLADLIVVTSLVVALEYWIPGLLLFSMLILAFMGRYTLWNFFGVENLVINTKSVSYQHDYGFIKTRCRPALIENRLELDVIPVKEGQKDFFRLCFISYGLEDSVPFEVYTTSFFFTGEEAKHLYTLIEEMFATEAAANSEFPPINLN